MFLQNYVDWVISLNNICNIAAISAVVRIDISDEKVIYYIQSSEIQENIVDIYCIFYIFTSENIKYYIFTPQECTYIKFLDYL